MNVFASSGRHMRRLPSYVGSKLKSSSTPSNKYTMETSSLSSFVHSRFFATSENSATNNENGGVPREEMPFVHFSADNNHNDDDDDRKTYTKFKSPRKLASKLFNELQREVVEDNKKKNPAVLNVPFRVGDAIEIEVISEGDVNSTNIDKIRGLVIGKKNRGLGSTIQLRDVVYGEPIERTIPLHSPLLKKLTVLEQNFLHKGKKRVKRAKLYYLRDRNPAGTFHK